MRIHIPCAALGLTLVAVGPAVAQTSPVVTAPAPAQTAGDATTTRTTRPVARRAAVPNAGRRAVATRRTYAVRAAGAPAAAVAATAPAPGYDYGEVPPAPAPVVSNGAPVYDVGPGAVAAPAGVVGPAAGPPVPIAPAVPAYQYIYQSDRILVVDPMTGIAMQALPR